MSSKQTIGIDTAKRVFFLHGEDARGNVILREKLSRERLAPFLANQPVSLIAIEAGCRCEVNDCCASSWTTTCCFAGSWG
jgi:hypothetical protein